MISPSPVVCAPSGSGRASSGSPLARASSTAAMPPGSSSQAQSTGWPAGPVTRAVCQRAPLTAAASTSRVPSPPSASGTQITWSPGRAACQPPASAAAAAAAPMLPLNESGAITTRTAPPLRIPETGIRGLRACGAGVRRPAVRRPAVRRPAVRGRGGAGLTAGRRAPA